MPPLTEDCNGIQLPTYLWFSVNNSFREHSPGSEANGTDFIHIALNRKSDREQAFSKEQLAISNE